MPVTGTRFVIAPVKLHDKEIKFYNHEGYLYLPGLIRVDVATDLRGEVLSILKQLGMKDEQLHHNAGASGKLHQTTQYLAGGLLDAMINGEALRDIASQLMGGDSRLYMPFTAVKCGGGGGTFHFHQDNQYTRFDGPGINLWMAMNPMTPDNGCLQVAPRSHQRGTAESVDSGDGDAHRRMKVEPESFLPVRMNAGDCIAFSRLTVHGSGPNITTEPRVAYAVQFHRDDVRATWDGQPPRLLAEQPRWNRGPVDRISQPQTQESLDGH